MKATEKQTGEFENVVLAQILKSDHETNAARPSPS
jgi:hypothetical protein